MFPVASSQPVDFEFTETVRRMAETLLPSFTDAAALRERELIRCLLPGVAFFHRPDSCLNRSTLPGQLANGKRPKWNRSLEATAIVMVPIRIEGHGGLFQDPTLCSNGV